MDAAACCRVFVTLGVAEALVVLVVLTGVCRAAIESKVRGALEAVLSPGLVADHRDRVG